jgi:CRISPR-associated Cas5-like protein
MLSEPICLRVKGPFACFTRPEFHVERVSYPVITPSAARGILEAILMKPIEKPCADQRGNGVGFRWRIKKLGVINKGYLMPMLRNEVGYQEHKKEAFESASTSPRVRSQRHSLILCGGSESGGARKPLDYLIEAVIDLDPEHAQRTGRQRPDPANARKYFEMFKRRATTIRSSAAVSSPSTSGAGWNATDRVANGNFLRLTSRRWGPLTDSTTATSGASSGTTTTTPSGTFGVMKAGHRDRKTGGRMALTQEERAQLSWGP